LPQLRTALVLNGMSADAAAFTCNAVQVGAQQQAITSLEEYREARTVCATMEEILTTLDDGSEVAAYCIALAHAIIDYEDAYVKKHGQH
jgi:hypothetical protein